MSRGHPPALLGVAEDSRGETHPAKVAEARSRYRPHSAGRSTMAKLISPSATS